jgi:hypothetical protein
MVPGARVRFGLAAALAVLGGCFVDTTHGDPVIDVCDAITCSVHGYCQGGECHCDRGWVGNPNAVHGCQPLGTQSPCNTTCGLNAYCDGGECLCDDGFVAVCSTGDCISVDRLCDGANDCVNAADEDPMVCFDGSVRDWTVIDDCDDGRDIAWRVWSQDRDWVWPNVDDVFTTEGFGATTRQSIECLNDEMLCFGGEAGDRQWGIGLDGTGSCDDCCWPCASDVVDMGALGCD